MTTQKILIQGLRYPLTVAIASHLMLLHKRRYPHLRIPQALFGMPGVGLTSSTALSVHCMIGVQYLNVLDAQDIKELELILADALQRPVELEFFTDQNGYIPSEIPGILLDDVYAIVNQTEV